MAGPRQRGAARMVVQALLTGAFCAVFTLTIDAVIPMVGRGTVVAFGAISGFLGSLFAQAVLRRR